MKITYSKFSEKGARNENQDFFCGDDKNVKFVTDDHNDGDYIGAPIT